MTLSIIVRAEGPNLTVVELPDPRWLLRQDDKEVNQLNNGELISRG
jgi:hypothetical protein